MEPASRARLLPLLLLLGLSSGAIIDLPQDEGREVWDYVTVRKDAHMFWWLYYATNSCKNFTELPLVMWLQGGPGGSSTGFGNFEEIGPLDCDLKPRRTTWLQSASLLFVDNPVGTGFSYVAENGTFAKDLATVASDMLVLLQSFFSCRPEFQTIPFYIFSESYGGKMAAGIALELHKAIQQGTIKCNFSGVALGDSWISPVDSVLSWGPYLYSMSLLDDQGLAEVSRVAEQVLDAINKGLYEEATQLWGKAEMVIEQNTDGVNFYNILTKNAPMSSMKSSLEFTQSHLGQANSVFLNMEKDFMKPVISVVDELLEAGVNVTVYNGQLDLIVDTMGQEAWMQKLKWSELPKFHQLKWKPLYSDPMSSETSAFVKRHKNLAFFWILRAGHMVPSDQGDMALKMMKLVTQQE
ncbi:PREDICTED: retinoid-inducible serine carboxypeptidase isoform X2 [Miniopterus natalensis]|uniref:retinoid-inducible serine carboxypeptidase isoform X2 n=1 Tax=Miniopterus natalensis TaxID=291302 RepID=UPI0007A71E47|nr:PREDICTED: retinoid-inducible serine carboxypeptidase isoform X2 [Miniopterus natalensis]